jgi:hypothetical protein
MQGQLVHRHQERCTVAFSNARPKLKIGLCPDRPQSAKNQQVPVLPVSAYAKDGMMQHTVIDGIYCRAAVRLSPHRLCCHGFGARFRSSRILSKFTGSASITSRTCSKPRFRRSERFVLALTETDVCGALDHPGAEPKLTTGKSPVFSQTVHELPRLRSVPPRVA